MIKTRKQALEYGLSFPDKAFFRRDIKVMIAESYDLISDSPAKRIYEAVK